MKIEITAVVSVRKNEGKVKFLTDVMIFLGNGTAIAKKTLGGKFNAVQALKEFKNRSKEFTPLNDTSPDWIATYAKVA